MIGAYQDDPYAQYYDPYAQRVAPEPTDPGEPPTNPAPPPPAPTEPPPSGGASNGGSMGGPSDGQPSHEYLLSLLHSGMKPQDAIEQTRKYFPNDAGLYYANKNIIGMAGYYLATGNPDDPKAWNAIKRSAEGGASGIGGSEMAVNPEYLAPWTEAPPSIGSVPEFQSPGAFQAPTGASIYADPSYQFRVGEGQHALENSAAARGVLNSGGTLSDIINYGQHAASQEYGQIFDRAFGIWNGNWNNALTDFRARKDVNDDLYGRAMERYKLARENWYENQQRPFNKLYQAASLGATAAAA